MGAITACAEDIGKRKGKPSIPGRKLLDPCREEERREEGETAPVRAESRRWTGKAGRRPSCRAAMACGPRQERNTGGAGCGAVAPAATGEREEQGAPRRRCEARGCGGVRGKIWGWQSFVCEYTHTG